MNKVFNYVRVSTKEQNLERQLEDMEKWNKENNIANAILLEDKSTGTNTDRENLQILLKVIGEGDLVVIKSIDRLSRNYKECKQLWEEITSKGADIVVIDMPILDTRTNKDLLGNLITDLFLTILGYVAQQETEFRKQRQMEGIEIAKAKGVYKGRARVEAPDDFPIVYGEWKAGNISAVKAMELLQLKKSTFYRRVKEYEGRI